MHALIATIRWAYGQLESATAEAEKAVLAANESAIAPAQLANILGARLASGKTGMLEKFGLSRRFRNPMVGGDKVNARHMVDQLIILDSTRGFALKAELDATNSDKAKGLLPFSRIGSRPSPPPLKLHRSCGPKRIPRDSQQ